MTILCICCISKLIYLKPCFHTDQAEVQICHVCFVPKQGCYMSTVVGEDVEGCKFTV